MNSLRPLHGMAIFLGYTIFDTDSHLREDTYQSDYGGVPVSTGILKREQRVQVRYLYKSRSLKLNDNDNVISVNFARQSAPVALAA